MTADEVLAELGEDTPLNRARRVFSSEVGKAELEAMQQRSVGPIELRRREFEAVRRILAAYGGTAP